MTAIDPLAQLEAWNRRYYRFRIECGGNMQPGDGVTVTLEAGGRRILVSDYELEIHSDDEDTPTVYPTIGDVIAEAIKRWHGDTTPKHYTLLWSDPAIGTHPIGEAYIKGPHWHSTILELRVIAGTEAEAIEQVASAYRNAGLPVPEVRVWEKGSVT